ncbi:DUF1835 domain-containing protein [Streptomyces albofaciens]|nr:DUF1835 domain-containing protein [Streptomyces albofaciens]
MEILHLVFGESAAEFLRVALGTGTADNPADPVQAYPR